MQMWEKGIKHIRESKALQNFLIILGVAVLALILISDTFRSDPPAVPKTGELENADPSPEVSLERRLEDVLSSVDGAGRVRVFISYAGSAEIEPAQNSTRNETRSDDAQDSAGGNYSISQSNFPVLIQDSSGTQPLIIRKKEPEILGVIVVAQGAVDVRVQLKLYSAVQTALQLSAQQIQVLPMVSE